MHARYFGGKTVLQGKVLKQNFLKKIFIRTWKMLWSQSYKKKSINFKFSLRFVTSISIITIITKSKFWFGTLKNFKFFFRTIFCKIIPCRFSWKYKERVDIDSEWRWVCKDIQLDQIKKYLSIGGRALMYQKQLVLLLWSPFSRTTWDKLDTKVIT